MIPPTLYHEEIGTITITSALSFRAAQVVWDSIAEKYSNKSLDKQSVRVIDKPIPDPTYEEIVREQKEAVEETAQKKIKALAPKVKNKHQSRAGIAGWSDEEMLLIQDIPEWREAVEIYKAKFPGKRSDNAIEQQSKKIQNGIVKKRSLSTPKTITKSPKLVVAPTEEREALPDVVSHDSPFNRGQKVKCTGPLSSPYYRKTGTIERTPPGEEVMVKFDSGSTWLSKGLLEVVA